jgi:hypothetical protein
MKRSLIFGMASAVLLCGCSDEELLNGNRTESNQIEFGTFVNKATRGIADDITNSTITNFSVYGYTADAEDAEANNWTILFDNEKVTGAGTTSGNNDSWTYDHLQYWTKGNKYHFHAIAPAENANWDFHPDYKTNTDKTDYSGTFISFTNNDSSEGAYGTQDLVYGYQSATGDKLGSNGKVKFTLKHLLSRVKFRFVAQGHPGINPINAHYTIKNVVVKSAPKYGNITISDVADATSGRSPLEEDLYNPDKDDKITWDCLNPKTSTNHNDLAFNDVLYKKNYAVTPTELNLAKLSEYTLDGKNKVPYFGYDGVGETDHKYFMGHPTFRVIRQSCSA